MFRVHNRVAFTEHQTPSSRKPDRRGLHDSTRGSTPANEIPGQRPISRRLACSEGLGNPVHFGPRASSESGPFQGIGDVPDRDRLEAVERGTRLSRAEHGGQPGRPGRRQPAPHPRASVDPPGEANFPDEGAPGRRRHPRPADASAAATASSHPGSSILTPPDVAPNSSALASGALTARCSTAATSWNRPESRAVAWRRAGPSVGTTSAWTSTASARRPRRGRAVADPGSPSPARSRAQGSISWSPSLPISNQATSPSAPNRFLPPQSIRSPERGSPSKVRTTSTACSSVRGPATSPSFVTWPARRTAMPSVLASPTSASVQPRTCAGPPGTWPPAESRRLWMESTASRNGRSALAASTSGPSSRPEGNLVPRLLTGGKEAGEPGSRQVRHQLEEKGRLADAGLAGQQGDGRGNQATAKNPVDAGNAGGHPGLAPHLVLERLERDSNGSRAGAPLLHRPPCAAARTATDPLAHRMAARRARQERSRLAHAGTLAMGSDRPR